ncbi:hypothetical protein K474DRAFT_1711584 [Panus rudis PR-1116 ss-1]|nr:hypothetical protein K474DRAFT_1711584 [Panus rudis PR-1116 ss-1]
MPPRKQFNIPTPERMSTRASNKEYHVPESLLRKTRCSPQEIAAEKAAMAKANAETEAFRDAAVSKAAEVESETLQEDKEFAANTNHPPTIDSPMPAPVKKPLPKPRPCRRLPLYGRKRISFTLLQHANGSNLPFTPPTDEDPFTDGEGETREARSPTPDSDSDNGPKTIGVKQPILTGPNKQKKGKQRAIRASIEKARGRSNSQEREVTSKRKGASPEYVLTCPSSSDFPLLTLSPFFVVVVVVVHRRHLSLSVSPSAPAPATKKTKADLEKESEAIEQAWRDIIRARADIKRARRAAQVEDAAAAAADDNDTLAPSSTSTNIKETAASPIKDTAVNLEDDAENAIHIANFLDDEEEETHLLDELTRRKTARRHLLEAHAVADADDMLKTIQGHEYIVSGKSGNAKEVAEVTFGSGFLLARKRNQITSIIKHNDTVKVKQNAFASSRATATTSGGATVTSTGTSTQALTEPTAAQAQAVLVITKSDKTKWKTAHIPEKMRPVFSGKVVLWARVLTGSLAPWATLSLEQMQKIPSGSASYFSVDNWGDHNIIVDGKTKKVKRATQYIKTLKGWKKEKWDEYLKAAWEHYEEPNRKQRNVIVIDDDEEEDANATDDDFVPFSQIAEQAVNNTQIFLDDMVRIAEEFDSAPQPLVGDSEGNNSRYGVPYNVSLVDLFDFTSTYWLDMVKRRAQRSLNDELELYSLIDLDADGDLDDEDAEAAGI